MRNEVSAADFSDFLSHARYYHSEGKKMEASVIAAAVFEDAINVLAKLIVSVMLRNLTTLLARSRVGAFSLLSRQSA